MFYGVVEFQSSSKSSLNKELSVVPLSWLIKNDRKCYWPTEINKVPLAAFIKSCPPPKKNWPRYQVFKVHFKTATHELAEKELDRIISEYEEMENFSNHSIGRKSVISESSENSSDTNDEAPLKKTTNGEQGISTFTASSLVPVNSSQVNSQKGSSAPAVASVNISNMNNQSNFALYTPSASSTSTMTLYKGVQEALSNDIIFENSVAEYSVVGRNSAGANIGENGAASYSREDDKCAGASNYVSNNGAAFCPFISVTPAGGSSAPPNESITSDFQSTVLSALGAIQTTNDQILLTMQEILRYNKKIAMEKLIAPEHLPSFPLKTYEEFLNFEKLAKEDHIVNQYMVRRLAALGGSGIDGVTRRIMKFLLANQLGNQFNWKGRHNKVGFEETTTMAIVYDAAKLNFPTNEKNDMQIACVVKEWLKHSSTRMKKQGNRN